MSGSAPNTDIQFILLLDYHDDYDTNDDVDTNDDDDNDDNRDNNDNKLTHGWRPPRGDERAQRDIAPKVIVIDFAEIQN